MVTETVVRNGNKYVLTVEGGIEQQRKALLDVLLGGLPKNGNERSAISCLTADCRQELQELGSTSFRLNATLKYDDCEKTIPVIMSVFSISGQQGYAIYAKICDTVTSDESIDCHYGRDKDGLAIIAGPAQSGKSSAAATIAKRVSKQQPDRPIVLFTDEINDSPWDIDDDPSIKFHRLVMSKDCPESMETMGKIARAIRPSVVIIDVDRPSQYAEAAIELAATSLVLVTVPHNACAFDNNNWSNKHKGQLAIDSFIGLESRWGRHLEMPRNFFGVLRKCKVIGNDQGFIWDNGN
jgi:hypothetical protein